ncbi:HDOD domain-containing protein [Sulfuricurvum sp. IAE1]|uniref:HDOD domain-containing protein n=1 Tax=Sulfuricurvum sp. IAE1 TaxID=2546102 RepID=UPI001048DBBF|nr:HDOD domain-containing protein [Sulfuricurvum sp. IAE1]MDD3770979.1 HDOD domain-containing protein [Sulfuricurvum sp.]TDA64194.1 HDOD domain-containing protein [Sulfuricurvum sp. IAE1]
MKSSIVNSIKSLPPLPKTVIDMQRVCNDPDGSIHEMVKVVEQDPMIVANLLKAANSPLYSFRHEITNVAQAVSLFGMSMTRSIGLGNSVRKLLNVDMEPYGISSERFAEISSIQAALMHKWYGQIDRTKADKLFLASFLQETGKILIASDVIQEHMETSFRSDIDMAIDIAQVERNYVEETTATVTAAIFTHWNFDEEFVDMIRFSDAPEEAPEAVAEFATALNIVKTIVPVNNPFGDHPLTQGLKKAEAAGYDVSKLQEAVDAIREIESV